MDAPLIERTIPSTGERIPVLGLGTFGAFDVPPRSSTMDTLSDVFALFDSRGGRVVDSSPMYGDAESVVGALRLERKVDDGLFIATKVWTQGRREGIAQMERSMKRLRAPRIDLMQVHNLVDVDTHLDTLEAWKQEGRIRYIGITHYHGGAFAALEKLLRNRSIDFVQFNYHALDREAEQRLLPAAADTGTAVLVNRPLGQGDLVRRTRGRPLPAWATRAGYRSWAQLALGFVIAHPAVTCVIPATGNPEHMADNFDAASATVERPAPDAAFARRVAQALASA
ncbi:MAG: aldo/keto reductase [Burkholderiales bacterium]|nr:aldo/keto reductase [Burkholderiales bacterium]